MLLVCFTLPVLEGICDGIFTWDDSLLGMEFLGMELFGMKLLGMDGYLGWDGWFICDGGWAVIPPEFLFYICYFNQK